MTTVASLQIKIGSDISAAINGLTRSEYAANRVNDSFVKATQSATQYGTLASIAAQRVSQATQGAQRILNSVSFDKLTAEGEKAFNKMQKLIDITNNAAVAAAFIGNGFVKGQQIGTVAITALGAAIPALGLKLAALAGPIGIALGAVGALVGGLISMKTAQDNTIDSQKELNTQIKTEQAEMSSMLEVLKSSTLTYEARGNLIEKINSKYGTTLKNIKDENDFVLQLDTAYQNLAESIKNKILIEAQQTSIKGLVLDIIQLEGSIEGLKKQNKEGPAALANLGGTPGQIQSQTKVTTGLIDAFTTSLNEKQTQLRTATDRIAELFNGVIFKEGKGAKGKNKTQIDEVKKVYDELQKTLTGINTKADKNLIKPLDVDDLQIDAFTAAINKLIAIDPTGKAAQDAIDRYKTLFQTSPVQINALLVPELSQLNNSGAGNAAKQAIDAINAAFEAQKVRLKFNVLPDGSKSKLDEWLDKYKSTITEAIAITSQLGNQLLNIANLAAGYDTRLDNLEEYYNKEEELINKSIASDSVKTSRKKTLEDDLNRKRKQILKEQAQQAKVNAIFNAIINTAQAVTKALGEGGPAYAVAVGILGGIEIGLIAGTPTPALAGGALVSGPNTVLVGEYSNAASNPELISPVDKVKKYIVEAVESAGASTSQLIGVIRNDDLYFMMQRAENRKFRTGA